MDIKAKRKLIEAQILKTINTLDRTGLNDKRYKEFFAALDDAHFASWMELIKSGQDKIYLYAPNMIVNIDLDQAIKAADELGVKLFEKIKLWDPVTRRYYLTPYEYLVLQLPVRRLKQYLMSKISTPDSDKTINPLSGQVTKPDKGSSISMTEAQTLDSKGLHKSLIELIDVRGGNLDAYAQFKSQLEETGEVSMNDLDRSSRVISARTARVMLQSMHLDNNL